VKSLIKNNLMLFVNDKKKALVFLVFAFFCGTSVGTAAEANMSAWEFILFSLTNHYYIIYFLFMTYIFFSLENMNKESDLVYVRMGTIKRQYICRIITAFLQAFIYVMGHVVIATIIGIASFGMTNQFNVAGMENGYDEVLLFLLAFKNYFSSPMMAVMAVAAYMSFGLGCISMTMYLVQRILPRKSTVVLVGILILNVMLGFKLMPGGWAELFFLNKHFVLHHVLFLDGAWYVVLNVVVACSWMIAGYYLLRYSKGNKVRGVKIGISQMNRKYAWYGAIFVTAYILLNFASLLITEDTVTATDLVFATVLGYSQESFYLTEFVRHVLFYIVPLFFVGAIWERERKARNQLVEIRYGNRKKWRSELARSITVLIAKYLTFFVVALIGIMVGVYALCGGEFSNYQKEFAEFMGIGRTQLEYLLLVAPLLKCVELIYYKNIFNLMDGICRNTVAAYILTFAGFVLTFVFPNSYWLSYGCSSLYSLAGKTTEKGVAYAVIATFAVLLIKIIVLELVNKYKKERFYE